MAKYLGGISDPNIEVLAVTQHFFDNDFDVEYYDYTLDTLTVQKRSIAQSILRYGEVTVESLDASGQRGIGALAGFNAGGLLGGVIGAVLGENTAGNEKHVLLCELDNGWKFALELNKNEYMAFLSVVPEHGNN